VILNLLSNAIKFSPEDGKISIKINRKKSKKLNNVAETVEITVQDEGMGIPKDQLELVFDQFEQSSNTNSNAGGTGLGLAISKKIIESHNGLIWAESPPEGKTFGAVLYIQLPAINS
jgi:signal transduction histidine kinase